MKPGKLFMAAAAAVRVVSVGNGAVWVSWLFRTRPGASIFFDPDLWRPGSTTALILPIRAWGAFPPPLPDDMTSHGMIPMRSHECLHDATEKVDFMKMSLHWPDSG